MTKNSKSSSEKNGFFPLVLIVEEDNDTRMMLKYLLEIWKYRVIEAADGEEAMRMAEGSRPNIVLLDYKLPYIDGLNIVRRMRERQLLDETIIIFVTACTDPAARASALAAGSDDFLIKPIDFGKLEISLEKHLRTGRKLVEGFITEVI